MYVFLKGLVSCERFYKYKGEARARRGQKYLKKRVHLLWMPLTLNDFYILGQKTKSI